MRKLLTCLNKYSPHSYRFHGYSMKEITLYMIVNIALSQ